MPTSDIARQCCAPGCGSASDPNTPENVPLCNHHAWSVIAHRRNAMRDELDEIKHKRVTAAPPAPVQHVVYYIEFADRIKIGTTTNLTRRIEALPVEKLLTVELGDTTLERKRHRQFWTFRVRGEWFTKSPELLAHIETVKADEHALPMVIHNIVRSMRGEPTEPTEAELFFTQ